MAIAIRSSSQCSKFPGLPHLQQPSVFNPVRTTRTLQKPAPVPKAYVGEHSDPYRTLGVGRNASEQEIKKAYRRLALKFHPDVCKGEFCKLRFLQINNAYEVVLDRTRRDEVAISLDYYTDGMPGVNDNSWEEWEEWMGWEGAGIRDYSSHINLCI